MQNILSQKQKDNKPKKLYTMCLRMKELDDETCQGFDKLNDMKTETNFG